eukprot:c12413_g1_i3.p1 GENE.c12413_g1_i3~~c12413_g1_i3.p1  ORF type:complete len:199 (+),score=52.71 c12413_g1_i3:92-688(+)
MARQSSVLCLCVLFLILEPSLAEIHQVRLADVYKPQTRKYQQAADDTKSVVTQVAQYGALHIRDIACTITPLMALFSFITGILYTIASRARARIRAAQQVKYMHTHPPPPGYVVSEELPTEESFLSSAGGIASELQRRKPTLWNWFSNSLTAFFVTKFMCDGSSSIGAAGVIAGGQLGANFLGWSGTGIDTKAFLDKN